MRIKPFTGWQTLKRRGLFQVVTVLLLTACTGNQTNQTTNTASNTAAPAAKPGGTLIWARYGDADSLDPHRTTTTLSWQVFDQVKVISN